MRTAMVTNRRVMFMVMTGLMFGVASAQAQDAVVDTGPAADVPADIPADDEIGSAFSVSAGVDFATQYIFRGIMQENQGSIIQPWADLGVNFYEGDDGINSIDMNIGIWNSIHSGPTGGDNATGMLSDPEGWYEADFYAGISVGFLETWTAGVTYTIYTSPNDAFADIEDIGLSLGYDDAKWWEDVDLPGFKGLQPNVNVIFEIDGQADGGMNYGTYLELAIEPSVLLIDNESLPITFKVPVTLGLSLDNYYEDGTGDDDTFGYVDVGFVFEAPLTFIPKRYGEWSAHAGVHMMMLGDSLQAISLAGQGNGDSVEVYGMFGIGLAF